MTIIELSKKLVVISEILNDSILFLSNSLVMLAPDESAKHTMISSSPFLEMSRVVMWKMGVIELNKLFGSKSDNYRLSALLSSLINQYNNSNNKSKITLEELKHLQEGLLTTEVTDICKQLNQLRDKHYAHQDEKPNNHISNIQLYKQHWMQLTQIATKIITILDSKILDKTILIKTPNGEVANDFLNERLEHLKIVGKYNMKYQ